MIDPSQLRVARALALAAALISPGFAFASAISSFTDDTRSEEFTVNTKGCVVTWLTAAKSRAGSYGTLPLRNGVMVWEA